MTDQNETTIDLGKLLDELFAEQKITKYVIFDGDDEGKVLPRGLTSESGTILTADNRVFRYWLDWDPEKTAPDGTKGWYTLGENFKDSTTGEPYPLFREIKPGTDAYPKPNDQAYVNAKKQLGIN
jgi:hypothetical protein